MVKTFLKGFSDGSFKVAFLKNFKMRFLNKLKVIFLVERKTLKLNQGPQKDA